MTSRLLTVSLLTFTLVSTSAFADSIDLPTVADTRVLAGVPALNEGTSAQASPYRNDGNFQAALLRFDFSAPELVNATIQSAILKLTNVNGASKPSATFSIYRIAGSWVENEVTFASRSTGVAWPVNTLVLTAPSNTYTDVPMPDLRGSDGVFYGTPFTTSTFATTGGVPDVQTWDITSLVQAWTSGEFDNDGLAITTMVQATEFIFATKENATAAYRPVLSITYTPFTTVTVTPSKANIVLKAKKTANVTVHGVATGSVTGIEYRLGTKGAFKPASGGVNAWNVALKKLKPGKYTLFVQGVDTLGTRTAPVIVKITVKKRK
jgi:hypothetical protein